MSLHLESVIRVLRDVLQLKNNVNLSKDSQLIGAIPEFDSMAVVSIITVLEEQYGFVAEDDEIDAEVFETVGSLVAFVDRKTA